MPARRRLATGVYEDKHGRSVVYHVNGHPKETRFPIDKPVDQLVKWRTAQIGRAAEEAESTAPRGSLARDIIRYLKRLKGQKGYAAEKAHLHAWLHYFPKRIRRWQITREKVALAIATWRQDDVAARTIRHRCRALKALYHRVDGVRMATPLDDVQLPPKPKPRPVAVADTKIAAVAASLLVHEKKGLLRDAKTRARFLVLATTGRRPAEVMRAQREDVDLHRRLWFTRTAKGGRNTVMALNAEMVAAWVLFMSAKAWGEYDTRSFAKTLRRNKWPKGIRPYNLRHSTGMAIRARGGDLEDVQDQLGHASIATTREYYLHALPDRQRAVSDGLSGRFAGEMFTALPRRSPTTGGKSTAKDTGIHREMRPSRRTPSTASADSKARKQA